MINRINKRSEKYQYQAKWNTNIFHTNLFLLLSALDESDYIQREKTPLNLVSLSYKSLLRSVLRRFYLSASKFHAKANLSASNGFIFSKESS